MASDDANQMYLAYGHEIKSLLGAPLGEDRLHIAPYSYQAIPLRKNTNELYQNFAVYQLGNSVPRDDTPVLTKSGLGVVAAYLTYLGDVDLSVAGQLHNPDAVKDAQADVANKEKLFSAALAAARVSFVQDCPNGTDPLSGQPITLASYLQQYHPEVATLKQAVQDSNTRYTELLAEQTGLGPINQLRAFRDAVAKGQADDAEKQGYNMPVVITDPGTMKSVVSGATPATAMASTYEPLYALSGTFDATAQEWIDTFPKDYPGNRKTFVEKAVALSYSFNSASQQSWADLGFSTSTRYSGSDGWIFWSSGNVETDTSSHQDVGIRGTDIDGDITVRIWRHDVFDINHGKWDSGNPAATFKTLYTNADPSVRENVAEQFQKVIVAYGVEIEFKLHQDAYNLLSQTSTQTQSSNSSLSIFGCIYSSGNSSYSTNTQSYNSLQLDESNNTIRMLAVNDGVPIVLAAIASRYSG